MAKRKVLFLAADPKLPDKLSLDKEIREITTKLEKATNRDDIEIVSAWAVRPDDFLEHLLRYEPEIVHFSGHGTKDGEIVLLDNDDHPTVVAPEALEAVFKFHRNSVRLVVLNACYSGIQAAALSKHVDYVIAMRQKITDDASVVFAGGFYLALGSNSSIPEAFEHGKIALQMAGMADWNVPELIAKSNENLPTTEPAGDQGVSFYPRKLLTALVAAHDTSLLRGDGFVLYPEIMKAEYYDGERLKMVCRRNSADFVREFPYKEMINFIDAPHSEISCVGDITLHQMREDIERLTMANWREFRRMKSNVTVDGDVLRLVYLKRRSEGEDKYQCCLEQSSYFKQARTNLTIDYTIVHEEMETTLRRLDMDLDGRLKPLEQSILVNSIGVSAVVYFQGTDDTYFFIGYRDSQGIYSNVLGTLSCAVTVSDARGETDLLVVMEKALRRKFTHEVGLDPSVITSVKPLAFDLELARGGKPQFFFLVEISQGGNITDSARGDAKRTKAFIDLITDEVKDRRTALSPEFVTNLLYAFQYLQLNANGSKVVVNLD